MNNFHIQLSHDTLLPPPSYLLLLIPPPTLTLPAKPGTPFPLSPGSYLLVSRVFWTCSLWCLYQSSSSFLAASLQASFFCASSASIGQKYCDQNTIQIQCQMLCRLQQLNLSITSTGSLYCCSDTKTTLFIMYIRNKPF